jgi:hypothetical protein
MKFWAIVVARNLSIIVTGWLLAAARACNQRSARWDSYVETAKALRNARHVDELRAAVGLAGLSEVDFDGLGPDCEHMTARGIRGPCYPCWRDRKKAETAGE